MTKLLLTALHKQTIKSNEIDPPPATNVHMRYVSGSVYCVGCSKLSQRVALGNVLGGGVVASCPCCRESLLFSRDELTTLENSGKVLVTIDR